MSADQKWGVFVAGCGVVILAIEGLVRLARWVMARVDRNVERMVDDGLAALVTTDDDFAEYAGEAIALTVPLYGVDAAGRIAAIIAHNEAARADWDEPARWTK